MIRTEAPKMEIEIGLLHETTEEIDPVHVVPTGKDPQEVRINILTNLDGWIALKESEKEIIPEVLIGPVMDETDHLVLNLAAGDQGHVV